MHERLEDILWFDADTLGFGDASVCLPGWIGSFFKRFQEGKGMELSPDAVMLLLHTLVAAKVRAERLVRERNELRK